MEILKKIFFKECMPFTNKRDLNKSGILKICCVLLFLLVCGVLIVPTQKNDQTDFHERVDKTGQVVTSNKGNDPTDQTIQEMKASQANFRNMPKSEPRLGFDPGGAGVSTSKGGGQNVSMILVRSGGDTRNSLTAGTRVGIVLSQSLTISNQTVPVIGMVSGDVSSENSIAIPEGTKVIGEASFDESNGRANLVWKTIILPDGREHPFSAVSIGSDNQVGIVGNVKSDAMKNTVGQVLTEFIGAYAEGSMTSGMLGSTEGGVQNGMKKAVSETAKNRANSYGEDLKKEHQWIELSAGTGFTAILSQSFIYRETGAL